MQENRCHLAGYLTAKPILRFLPSGTAIANAQLGQSYQYSHNGTPAEHTNWFDLVFYGDLANLATELERGTNLYVEGSFDQRPVPGEDQRKHYLYEVTVHKFFAIGGLSNEPSLAPRAPLSGEAEMVSDGSEISMEQIAWPI